jgi:autotransporter-associated beta strand protein
VDYASREAAIAGSRPQLLIVTLGAAPTISDITNRTVPVNSSTGPVACTIGDLDTTLDTLALSGTSSNTNVVPNANIIFGGSGANRTVTVTPAPNKSGVATITITVSDSSGLSSSDNFTLTVSSHSPGTFVWNGPGAGANNWSASGNWQPAGPPESWDNVKCFDAGASGLAVSNINNVVDANFGGEVASLQYANTNGNHTTQINSGQTLTLSGAGGLMVGTETDNGAQQVFATVTGSGGTLVMDDGAADLIVRQGASAGGARSTLDLSGLDEFNTTASQLLVGFAGTVIRATGTLNLAKTNNLVATGSPGICVGDNPSNGGGQNFLFLGQQNSVFADSIVIGRKKATSTLKFKSGLVNPSALFRGADGVSAIASWSMGDGATLNASSSSSVGTNDFSGGTVDALVDTLTVGRSQQTSGANGIGVLTYSSGIFEVNTLQVGFQTQSGVSAALGFVTLNGPNAVLNVNSVVTLGACGGAVSTNVTRGALNVFGGIAGVNAISIGPGSGANALAVNAGTLAITNTAGTLAVPIDTVALTNASLQLFVAPGVTNIAAAHLVTGGASNVVNIARLAGNFAPAQFPLIKYAGAIGGAGFNFKLGAFPPGIAATGYVSNNTANSSVDLVITGFIVPDSFLTWDGTVSGDWDAETANWKNNVQGGLVYADGSDVVFNDSATGPTVVNLTDTLAPASVTVSNNADAYAFVGSGNLSGAMSLAKNGAGTLLLANGGSNNFIGDVMINSGVLWVGDGTTNGNLPTASAVTDNGALVFSRSDSVAVPNTISGTGQLTNNGTSNLTLSAINTYSGSTVVNSGELALTNGATIANSTNIVIASGAILDAGGRVDGALTLAAGQTLQGNGSIVGDLVNAAGATISPGTGGIGVLSVSGSVTSMGTLRMELNHSLATNDVLRSTGSIVYGGVLVLTNVSGALTSGDSFRLFDASGYSGSFTNIVPAIPGVGLAWNTNTLASNGTLTIVSAATPQPQISGLSLTASGLVISGSNGVAGWPYLVLSATNLTVPAGNWQVNATNTFDSSGNFIFTNPIDPLAPQEFYLLRLR